MQASSHSYTWISCLRMLLSDLEIWISDSSESTPDPLESGSSFFPDRCGCPVPAPGSPPDDDDDDVDEELLFKTDFLVFVGDTSDRRNCGCCCCCCCGSCWRSTSSESLSGSRDRPTAGSRAPFLEKEPEVSLMASRKPLIRIHLGNCYWFSFSTQHYR